MEYDLSGLDAVESRLRCAILAIVQRRKSGGAELTWRVMFDIEDEAMSMLRNDVHLDDTYIRMMSTPNGRRAERLDDAVGLADMNAMHTVLWMIQEAYYHRH